MLEFLVTSKARRRLVLLLWGEGARGTASELADRAGVAFSQAHRELQRMLALGLVRTEREAKHMTFAANPRHPNHPLLRSLARAHAPSSVRDRVSDAVRRQLKALGAPLHVKAAKRRRGVERVLAEGARLARRDPTVARVMPVCLWNTRDILRWQRLLDEAHTAEEKHALGFFLELTGELSGDPRFEVWASMFRDQRVSAKRRFFQHPVPTPRTIDDARSPPAARKWGFVMNTDEQSFQSTFDKFAA